MSHFFIGMELVSGVDKRERELVTGLVALGIDPDRTTRMRLLAFLDLLDRWNRAYNLTAVTDPKQMVARHLLDSLSLVPWLSAPGIIDAGSGAGLPGVPLAIACPGRNVLLVDSNGKRIRFLRHVRRKLGLSNIEPVHARIEQLDPGPAPIDIVARAVAPLPGLVRMTAHGLDRGARLLAMKGRLADSELAAVPDAYNVRVVELEVPGQAAERKLVIVEKKRG